MVEALAIDVDEEKKWQMKRPELQAWQRDDRSSDRDKYLIVSCDVHLNPPVTQFQERMNKIWPHLLPRIERHDDGERYILIQRMRADSSPVHAIF